MNIVGTHCPEDLAERRASAAALLRAPSALTTWAAAQHTSVARAEFILLQELTAPSTHLERSEQQQQQQQATASATAAAQREASPPPSPEQQQAAQAAQQQQQPGPEEEEHRDIGMDPYQFEELNY